MAQTMVLILGLMSMLACCCRGYRYGPPMDACTHMFPTLHGYDARDDMPPFTFYLSQNTYNPNDVITVFINSSINPANPTYEWFMEGILVQARTLDCGSSFPVGNFSVPDCDEFLQPIDCLGIPNSAIRHFSHLHVYNKTFTWRAPSQPVGHVYLRATVARNQEKFWTNVFSEIIRDPTDTNTNYTFCPVVSKLSQLVTSDATIFPQNMLLLWVVVSLTVLLF